MKLKNQLHRLKNSLFNHQKDNRFFNNKKWNK
jgi:hypothetical protein